LAAILADSQADLAQMAQGKVDWLLPRLTDPAVVQYLGVNEHNGSRWLRKESLELFLDAIVISCLTTCPPDNPTHLFDSWALIAQSAENSNYEMERFEEFLRGF